MTPADRRELGGTGIRVSPIGLGTVKFGRNTGVKYSASFSLPDDKQLARLVSIAEECGINLADTAPAYGSSEERLGRLLATRRDRWILCTKVGESFEAGKSTFDFSRSATRSSVERSLRRLATDYLDIVLVHCSDTDAADLRNTDVVDTLLDLKAQGYIRAIGASTKTVEGGLACLESCDVVMAAYNPEDQSQLTVLEQALHRNAGVLVKKALESGHATDPARALRFILAQDAVSSVIVGTIDEAHLRANVAAVTEN